MHRLAGRVAFVTGAARGIGRATAVRLATEGASVVVADVDGESADAVARELSDDHRPALAVACDVTDRVAVERAITVAAERLGRLDVLVNNAGVGSGTPFADGGDEEWAGMFDLNFNGAVRCIQAALPYLLSSSYGGNVVTIGSVNGLAAWGDVAYSAAKAALRNLTQNLAAEYGPRGVRFNLVAPGTVRTRVWRDREEQLDRLAKSVYPLRRVGVPEDIAAAVAFLASEDAAWITGAVLPVDGGGLVGPAASSLPQ